jgi:Nucleotidyltransferase of unknown function (DUF6036)
VTRFDRSQLVTFLRAIDRNLTADIKIVVVGGAAVVVGYGAEAMTSDIDVLSLAGSERIFSRAVDSARKETRLAVGVSGAAIFTSPDGFEDRLRSARGLRMQRLTFKVPEKYDLALSKIAASGQRPHDLEAVERMHQKHPLSRRALVERFEAEMQNVAVSDPRQLSLTMAIAVARLYGYEAGKKLAQKYGVPVPRLNK